MQVFSDRLVEDLGRLPGGRHTFLAQVCAARGRRHRAALQALVDAVGEPLATRVAGLLTSFDNRRFFQGVAELTVAALLERGAFRVEEVGGGGDWLGLRRRSGAAWDLVVLAFIQRSRVGADVAAAKRLLTALDRAGGNRRYLVGIQRPLPDGLDTDEVRRAVETWLADVERGRWEGRYAIFKDAEKGVQIEFALTGRQVRFGSRVCTVLGPYLAPTCLLAVEARLLEELERRRQGRRAGRPTLVACVGDRPWPVSPGYLRDFLYGRARSMEMRREGEGRHLEVELEADSGATLFRDPLCTDVGGLLWVGREPSDPSRVHCSVHLNPWARTALDAAAFPSTPVFARERDGEKGLVIRWHHRAGPRVRIL